MWQNGIYSSIITGLGLTNFLADSDFYGASYASSTNLGIDDVLNLIYDFFGDYS